MFWLRRDQVRPAEARGFNVICRAPGDPERSGAGKGQGRGWAERFGFQGAQALKQTQAARWAEIIREQLQDGEPRTFHRLAVELLDISGDVAMDSPFEVGLDLLFDAGELVVMEQDSALHWRLATPEEHAAVGEIRGSFATVPYRSGGESLPRQPDLFG